MTYDSADMSARGRIGACMLRARHDPKIYTAPARKAFLDRFIPDDASLSEEERMARAKAALRAHMLRLARRSALVRRRKGRNDGKD